MLVMVVFFIAFRWIHLSTPLIRLFLLVLILLLMPTLNFLPVWFALSLLRFRLPSRLPMMFILWMVAMMVVIIPDRKSGSAGMPSPISTLFPYTTLFRSFFACLVRFESSSVPTTLPTAYDVYPLDGRHDGGYYTVKDCVTIDVLPRTPGNNVYVGFMVWSNFTATKCRGLVSLNQVIKEIICLQPLK